MLNVINILTVFLVFFSLTFWAQHNTDSIQSHNPFWKDVHFGGGVQLSIGNGYTVIGVSPSAAYEFSDKWATGIGLSYVYTGGNYIASRHIYGGNILAMYNPIKEAQLSLEFEELRVHWVEENNTNKKYWIPAFYVGVAYSMGRMSAIGVRYDLLYDESKSIYDSAFTPFFRIYF